MKKEISEILNLINNKNIDKAFVEAKKLFHIDPRNINVIKVLSFLHIQKNQFQSTIDLLLNYFEEYPEKKDFDFYINLGVSYKSIEEYRKALNMYEKAKELDPSSPLCYTVPAEIYLKLRNYKRANELIDAAIEIINRSDVRTLHFPNAIKIKTEVNVAMNKDEDNSSMLLSILDKEFNPDIFYLLAINNSKKIDENLLNMAESYLKGNDKGFKNSLDRFWYVQPLYFALAVYYQKLNRTKSEEYYHLGNAEIMKSLRYNSFGYQKNILDITENYQTVFADTKISDKKLGSENFFILGTPRSGTTLIESMIGINQDVASAGELLSASKLIQDFIEEKEKQDIEIFREYFQKTYSSRTSFIKGSSKYILDKLPENFLFIGQILGLLPGSKIIRTFRHPWDVAISLYKQRYVTNIPYSASFFNIGVFMANFEAINIYWDQKIENKENILDVYYEKLVIDPEKYRSQIYEFLHLNENEFDEKKRQNFFSQTASIRQIGDKIHKKSVKKQDFLDKKSEFYDALLMQRKYWQKKGLNSENSSFFGYTLD